LTYPTVYSTFNLIGTKLTHKQGVIILAKNTGNDFRRGAVDNRSQTYNPKTEHYVKRDTETGRFMDVKTSSSAPFKGVRKEK